MHKGGAWWQSLGEFALQIYFALGQQFAWLKGEMRHDVVGLIVAAGGSFGISDGETPELRLVVEILRLRARLVHIHRGVVVGLKEIDFPHIHIKRIHIHGFHASVFVAGIENECGVVVIHHVVACHHHRAGNGHGIVGARILAHHSGEFFVGIADGALLMHQLNAHLLMRIVVVHIGACGDAHRHIHHLLAHAEAGLKQHRFGVVLLVNAQQIVARFQNLHLLVRKGEIVVKIVCHSAFALDEIGDVGLIKPAHIFVLQQLRRLPIGITVSDAIAQIVGIVGEHIEVHIQLFVAVELNDGHTVSIVHRGNF